MNNEFSSPNDLQTPIETLQDAAGTKERKKNSFNKNNNNKELLKNGRHKIHTFCEDGLRTPKFIISPFTEW